MAITPVPQYTGDIPEIGQNQPTFNQNTSDMFDYIGTVANGINTTASEIDTASQSVDDNRVLAENAANTATGAVNFAGAFVSGSTSAIAGKSYSFGGGYWVCLSNTTTDPSVTNANWKKALSVDDLNDLERRSTGVGVQYYRGSNGKYVQNGDVVPAGTTHLAVVINGKVEDVAMSPIASGAVSLLSEVGATIGGTAVSLSPRTSYISKLSDIANYPVAKKQVIEVGGYYEEGDCSFKLYCIASADIPDGVFTHATGTAGVIGRVVKSDRNNPRAFGMGIGFNDTGVKMQAYFDAAEQIAETIVATGGAFDGSDPKTLPDFSEFGLDFGGSAAYYETSVSINKSRNLRISNVSHYAKSNYSGGEYLIQLSGGNGQYSHEDFEFASNTWHCNYKCDGLHLIDFLRGTFSGHTGFYSYLRKGFRVAPRSDGSVTSHELVNEGTLSCFQKLFGNVYPLAVTEGEAFELNAPDMQLNTLVIGDQFTNVATINASAVFIDNFHFYAGDDKRLFVNDKAVYLNNGYFDGNGIEGLGSDLKVTNVRFFSSTNNFEFLKLNNLLNVNITDSTFSSDIASPVDRPVVLGGAYSSTGVIAGAKIYDNSGENVNVSAPSTKPLVVFNFAGETQLTKTVNKEVGDVAEITISQVGNDGGALFTASYNSVSRQITVYVKSLTGDPLAWSNQILVRVNGFNQ